MQSIAPAPPESTPAPRAPVISFRLDRASLQALSTRAARLEVSVHELARHYVVEGLTAAEVLTRVTTTLAAVHEDVQGTQPVLEGLQQHLLGLRMDLALAVQALLLSSGRVDAQQAQAWAEANLNQPWSCSP